MSYHGGWRHTRVSWLSHTSTSTTFFPKQPTTFLTCFSIVERQKKARKKVCLNRVSNSQPTGHGSDTLTTEPPRWRENFNTITAKLLELTAQNYQYFVHRRLDRQTSIFPQKHLFCGGMMIH